MNNKTTDTSKRNRNGYLIRGFLLWGSVYTAGISGMVYPLVASTACYADILLYSLIICPICGMASGYLRWQVAGFTQRSLRTSADFSDQRHFTSGTDGCRSVQGLLADRDGLQMDQAA